MRKMFSKKQIEDIAKENGLTLDKLLALLQGSNTISVDESEDGQHVVINMDEDYANDITRALKLPLSSPAEIKIPLIGTNNAQVNAGLENGLEYDSETGKLVGKFVHVMSAPESTTLTTEEEEQIRDGVFIKGDFLGLKNSIFFPLGEYGYGVYFGKHNYDNMSTIGIFSIFDHQISINPNRDYLSLRGIYSINNKGLPSYSKGFFYYDGNALKWYEPVAQDNITSGDTIAVDSNLGKALIDHLEVEINGYRARYEYTSGDNVVYSSKSEANGGLKLQVNMITYNTTNGTLTFNQMTFTPDA